MKYIGKEVLTLPITKELQTDEKGAQCYLWVGVITPEAKSFHKGTATTFLQEYRNVTILTLYQNGGARIFMKPKHATKGTTGV